MDIEKALVKDGIFKMIQNKEEVLSSDGSIDSLPSKLKCHLSRIKKLIVRKGEFTLLEPVAELKGKLGAIHRVLLNGKNMVARVIEFDKLTTYLNEETMTELDSVMRLDPQ